MTMTLTLGGEALRALTLVVDLGRHHGRAAWGAPPLPWPVLRVLQELLLCRVVWFRDLDHVTGRWVASQRRTDTGDLLERDVLADGAEVARWVDRWWSGWEPPPTTLALRMPCAPGRLRWLTLERDDAPFAPEDVLVAALLTPHLHEVWRRSGAAAQDPEPLTPREWEVLHLAGEGLSNAAIADRLHLAPGTVRKHLEHVFDKVGVRTRSGAAAAVLPDSPYAAPRGGRLAVPR